MNIGAQTWFYWPVTVAASATATAAHLYYCAARNGRPARLSALGGVAALAIPVLPLALATRARCNDTGQRTFFEPSLILLSVAIGAWIACLWALYRFAGKVPESATRSTAAIGAATSVGFVVEFFASQISLMTYCNDTAPGLRLVHLGVAVAIALLGALTATAVMKSLRSTNPASR
jgi:hypothetical protein